MFFIEIACSPGRWRNYVLYISICLYYRCIWLNLYSTGKLLGTSKSSYSTWTHGSKKVKIDRSVCSLTFLYLSASFFANEWATVFFVCLHSIYEHCYSHCSGSRCKYTAFSLISVHIESVNTADEKIPFVSDVRGSCASVGWCGPVPRRGLRLPLALPYPGHSSLPAVQCGALHRQSPGQVSCTLLIQGEINKM